MALLRRRSRLSLASFCRRSAYLLPHPPFDGRAMLKPNAKPKKRTGPKLPPRPKLIIKPRPAAEPMYPLFAYKDRHDQMVARVHQSLERMKQASERGANLSIFSTVEEAVEAIFDNGVPPNRTWLVLGPPPKKTRVQRSFIH